MTLVSSSLQDAAKLRWGAGMNAPTPHTPSASEVEAEFYRFGARRNVVRAAKRGKEIIEHYFVRQVDDRETQAPLVAISVKQIVVADAGIEEVPRQHALRIVVIIFRTWRRDLE
jgi:hypothetical protein